MNWNTVVFLSLVFITQACSNQQLYQVVNSSARQQCYELPESEIQECLDRNNDSYNKYEQKRETATGN